MSLSSTRPRRGSGRDCRSGASTVLFAISLTMMVATLGIAIDVGYWYHTKSILQAAAESAALAGVVELPNASAAAQDANSLATLNGALASEISVSRALPIGSMNPNRYEVVLRRNSGTIFSIVLGVASVAISVRSVAQIDVSTNPNPKGDLPPVLANTLYSGREFVEGTSTPDVVNMGSNSAEIEGPIQVNGSLNVSGNSNEFEGPVRAGHAIGGNGNSNQFQQGSFSNSAIVAPPVVDTATPLAAAKAAGTYYAYDASNHWNQWDPASGTLVQPAVAPAGAAFSTNKLVFSASSASLSGIFYLQGGDIVFSGNNVSGSGSFVTDGTITFSGNSLNFSASSAVGFVSLSSDPKAINLTANTSTIHSALFAPNGGVSLSGNSTQITGGIYANHVDVPNGANSFHLSSGASSVAQLPVMRAPLKYVHLVD
ncbi:MAG: pilus assembly protein [Candidatus Wallbacteria bacterium]|nr:pilus assembly protein [Candidatus Wallbacteria bacterium]